MTYLKETVFLLLLFFSTLHSNCQSIEFQNIRHYKSSNAGLIYTNDALAGYYHLSHNKDDKSLVVQYKVDCMDLNLNIVGKFEFEKNNKSELIQIARNENYFVFAFYDVNGVELMTFDPSGKLIAQKNEEDIDDNEHERLGDFNKFETDREGYFTFVNDECFIRYKLVKNKKTGYIVECFNRMLELQWEYKSDVESKAYEFPKILFGNEKTIAIGASTRNVTAEVVIDQYLVLLDSKTGKQLNKYNGRNKKRQVLRYQSAFFNEKSSKLTVAGVIYVDAESIEEKVSDGMFIQTFDSLGNTITHNDFYWTLQVDAAKLRSLKAKPITDYVDATQIWIHNVVSKPNGNLIAIGEQYDTQDNARKNSFALGLALLSPIPAPIVFMVAGAPKSQYLLSNMVFIEFNSQLEIIDVNFAIKRSAMIGDSYNGSFLSPYSSAIDEMVKRGRFGYRFTQLNKETDTYEIIYEDRGRKPDSDKSEKADIMIGIANVGKEESGTTRIPIYTHIEDIQFMPASVGFLLVREYDRKLNKEVWTLQKVKS